MKQRKNLNKCSRENYRILLFDLKHQAQTSSESDHTHAHTHLRCTTGRCASSGFVAPRSIGHADTQVVGDQPGRNTVDYRLIIRRLGGVVVTSPTPSVKTLLTGGGSVLGGVHEGAVGKSTSKASGPGGDRVVESERAHTVEQHFVGFIILVRKLVLFR